MRKIRTIFLSTAVLLSCGIVASCSGGDSSNSNSASASSSNSSSAVTETWLSKDEFTTKLKAAFSGNFSLSMEAYHGPSAVSHDFKADPDNNRYLEHRDTMYAKEGENYYIYAQGGSTIGQAYDVTDTTKWVKIVSNETIYNEHVALQGYNDEVFGSGEAFEAFKNFNAGIIEDKFEELIFDATQKTYTAENITVEGAGTAKKVTITFDSNKSVQSFSVEELERANRSVTPTYRYYNFGTSTIDAIPEENIIYEKLYNVDWKSLWESFLDSKNFSMDIMMNSNTILRSIKVSGDTYYDGDYQKAENIYTKDQDAYFKYFKASEYAQWKKKSVSHETYDEEVAKGLSLATGAIEVFSRSYSEFTYKNNVYRADFLLADGGYELSQIAITILEGQVAEISFQWPEVEGVYRTIYVKDFGNTNIELPTEVVEIPAPTGISLDEQEITLKIDDTRTLLASVSPFGAEEDAKIVWDSNNDGVATVSQTGLVTAISKGSADITVTLNDEFTAKCTVTVIVAPPKTAKGATFAFYSAEPYQYNKGTIDAKAEEALAMLRGENDSNIGKTLTLGTNYKISGTYLFNNQSLDSLNISYLNGELDFWFSIATSDLNKLSVDKYNLVIKGNGANALFYNENDGKLQISFSMENDSGEECWLIANFQWVEA